MTEKDVFIEKFNNYFKKLSAKCKNNEPTQALVYSEKNKIDFQFSGGNNQPFHIASIGKMMTATIIGTLSDNGRLDIDDQISKYLSGDVINGLFVFNGTDYKDQITIHQLLNHTSGISDYFESKTNAGSKFVDQIMQTPDKLWSPMELVDFTRNNQSAKSAPGQFSYSDTGYVLLGLIIESITKMTFAKALEIYIFKPLFMNDSYLLFGGQPINRKREIANILFNGTEINKLNMLSCDWAGGGAVSTLSDLLLFQQAFWSGKLVSNKFINAMTQIENKFRSGMHYGAGMMELRFDEFFFLLRGMSRPLGHSGILGTLMFYDKQNDLHIIINMGSNKRVVDSIKAIIYIEQMVSIAAKNEK